MNSGEIDRVPITQLPERYGIVRSAMYTRFEALGIKPERIGNKSYVNSEQLALFDDLHEFLKSGGTTAEFLDMRGLQKATESAPQPSSGLSTIQPETLQLAAMIAAQVASQFQPPPPEADPLAYFEKLENAARNGWILRTSEVAFLLDLLPSDLQQYGDSFSEAGFVFTRAGYRSGGEVAWKVSKPVK